MRRICMMLPTLVMLAFMGCANQQDPAAFVHRYTKLHRSRNIEGLLALHTADSEFLIPGQEPIRGTAALRDLFEWDAVLGSELEMAGIRSEGNTIIIDSIIERNKWFEALGIAKVQYKPGTRIVLRGGRIVGTYPAALDDESQRRVVEGFQAVYEWVGKYRRDALEQLLPGGKFRYDEASARLWLEVLAEWKNSRRPSS